jgi:fatty acid desaturase
MNLKELRNELRACGYFEKKPGRVATELILHFIVALGGLAVFITAESTIVRIVAILISTIGSMGVGTNTHTSSHYGTARRKWVNEYLTYLGYPLFLGLSSTYWHYMHVVCHHPAPNVMGKDGDHDLMPWFSIIRQQFEGTKGIRRFYYEHIQWLLFPIALSVNGLNMQKAGWLYLIRSLGNSRVRRKAHYLDFTAMLLHYVVWIGLPALFFPLGDVLLLYVLRITLLGYAMFAVLAPGHFPEEATCFEKADLTEAKFAFLQATSSVNFRTGVLGRFLCSGLEYQIEHHMFPHLSHVHYPKVARHVEAFCRENGYPYRTFGWGEAIWKSFQVFRTPKQLERELVLPAGDG